MPIRRTYRFVAVLLLERKRIPVVQCRSPIWHQKDRLNDHLPKNLRGVDKTATWSKSGYHGWVYDYALHLTSIRNGFPILFEVLPAHVYETPSHNLLFRENIVRF
ncbi:MAG: hypothetical protein OYL97_08140 [Candidatus Poribacteria bacterium]|nr:hypothetical protein [Candidatus Poribacteria bacterium]